MMTAGVGGIFEFELVEWSIAVQRTVKCDRKGFCRYLRRNCKVRRK